MARLNLGWLKPPKASPDGVMSLADHLRELRYRLIFSVVVIFVGMIACLIFYNQLFQVPARALRAGPEILKRSHPNLEVQAVLGPA